MLHLPLGVRTERGRSGGRDSHWNFLVYVIVVFFSSLVTGEMYAFNSKTGSRKWKDPLTQMPKWKELSSQGAAPCRVAAGEGMGPLRSTNRGKDELSGKAWAEDAGLGSRNEDGKPGTPKNRNPAFINRASPKPHPGK